MRAFASDFGFLLASRVSVVRFWFSDHQMPPITGPPNKPNRHSDPKLFSASPRLCGRFCFSRSRAIPAITAIFPHPYPLGSSQIGVDLKGYHPRSSQTGPVHARFSRGWVEIGVDFSDSASIGVDLSGFPITRCTDHRITRSTYPSPYPYVHPSWSHHVPSDP